MQCETTVRSRSFLASLSSRLSSDDLDAEIPVKKSLIVFGPNNVTVSEGETVQLHCLTQAAATVQWLHNNEMINLNVMRRYEMLPSGGLRIVSAQKSDSGVYECLASKIGFGTSSAKCSVHVQGLSVTLPGSLRVSSLRSIHPLTCVLLVSKLEIIHLNQIQSNAIELSWKINETIANSLQDIQVQYRPIHPKTSWMTVEQFYNRSIRHAVVNNLQQEQAYKFRLIGFDSQGKQLVISAAKRVNLQVVIPSSSSSLSPEMSDAWVTNANRGISPMSNSVEIGTPSGTLVLLHCNDG